MIASMTTYFMVIIQMGEELGVLVAKLFGLEQMHKLTSFQRCRKEFLLNNGQLQFDHHQDITKGCMTSFMKPAPVAKANCEETNTSKVQIFYQNDILITILQEYEVKDNLLRFSILQISLSYTKLLFKVYCQSFEHLSYVQINVQ